MTRYWPDSQLDRITPPQVLDERGKAILRSLDHIIGERPIEEFYVRDAVTCPSEALPALIAETSMEEFIEPGLPEAIVRRILKHAWLLQSLAGKDDGVLLGLSLLGINATITQWWQTKPKGRKHPGETAGVFELILGGAPLGSQFVCRRVSAGGRWPMRPDQSLGPPPSSRGVVRRAGSVACRQSGQAHRPARPVDRRC